MSEARLARRDRGNAGEPTEAGGPGRRSITILERDADAIHFLAQGPRGQIEVITSLTIESETAILRGLHIDGPGPGSLGVRELRELTRELGRQLGVRRVVIFGATRYTGANPGRVPRPIVIEVI